MNERLLVECPVGTVEVVTASGWTGATCFSSATLLVQHIHFLPSWSFCLMQMFLNVANLACCGAVSRRPADRCLKVVGSVVSQPAVAVGAMYSTKAICSGVSYAIHTT